MADLNITKLFLNFALLGASWVMYILVACSILSVAVILERIVYFSKFRGNVSTFIANLIEKLSQGEDPEKLAAWCSGQSLLEAKIAAAGLQKAHLGIRAAEEAMSAFLITARTQMERGLMILGTLGSNTPFIGLLGTVIGIIGAFHSLATNTSAGPELVMAEISEALVATALGLLVAVPAVIAYNVMNRIIKKKLANSEAIARMILTHLN